MSEKKRNSANEKSSPGKRVTLRDIAQAVGVSHTTVSLALSNNPTISEKRRKEIQKKAGEMGYRPDPNLAALAYYRKTSRKHPIQSTIAWLNFWKDPEQLRSYREFDLYWQGAMETADRAGYRLEEFYGRTTSLKRLAGILKARGIEGILLAPYPDDAQERIEQFPFDDFKTVRFGWNYCKPYLHSVTTDLIGNAELVFKRMYQKGYRRIGFVSLFKWKRPFGAGFFWAQQYSQELAKLQELHLPLDHPELHKEMLDNWLRSEAPDGILTDLAILPAWLAELGYKVPEDIGLTTISTYDTPINAGIDQNPLEIGQTAVRTLISFLNNWHVENQPGLKTQTLVPARWVDGDMLPERN